MKNYIINLTDIKSQYEFYEAIVNGMEFPKWCGKNADAIRDMMTSHITTPCNITILGKDSLPYDLKDEFKLIEKILIDAKKRKEKFNKQLNISIK